MFKKKKATGNKICVWKLGLFNDQKAATVGVDVVQQSTRLIAGLYVAGGFCSAPSHSGNHNHIGRIEGETHW